MRYYPSLHSSVKIVHIKQTYASITKYVHENALSQNIHLNIKILSFLKKFYHKNIMQDLSIDLYKKNYWLWSFFNTDFSLISRTISSDEYVENKNSRIFSQFMAMRRRIKCSDQTLDNIRAFIGAPFLSLPPFSMQFISAWSILTFVYIAVYCCWRRYEYTNLLRYFFSPLNSWWGNG